MSTTLPESETAPPTAVCHRYVKQSHGRERCSQAKGRAHRCVSCEVRTRRLDQAPQIKDGSATARGVADKFVADRVNCGEDAGHRTAVEL